MLHEGFDDGFKGFKTNVEATAYKHYRPDLKKYVNVQPRVREVRLVDVVIKEDFKDQFLKDLKSYSPAGFLSGKFTNKRHKNFNVGLFRKLVQTVFTMIGIKPFRDLDKIEANKESQLSKRNREDKSKYGRHGYIMPIGELEDYKDENGRERT